MQLQTSISYKEMVSIAMPIMIGNFAQTLITFVDTVFIGHLGVIELGAVIMAGIYYYVFSTLAWGFAVGIQIVIARRFGEGSYDRIGSVFEHGLFFVSILSVLLFLLLHFFTEGLLDFVIDSPQIYDAAMQFMKYRHYGIIFVCFNFLFRALYIGLSNTKVITYTTILMAVVNIILDYLLIFGKGGFPALGMGGAAIASVCAEISALLFFIFYTYFRLPIKKYKIFSFKSFEKNLIGSLIRLSLPTMVQRIFSFGIWFVFFVLIEQMGELPIAISGITRSVYMLLLIPAFALGATANTLTSRLIGAGKTIEIKNTLLKIMIISYCFVLPLVLICVIFPESLASLFTQDAQLAVDAAPVLHVICVGALCACFGAVFFEAVSGTGNTLSALFIELLVLVGYVFYVYLNAKVLNSSISVVWYAEVIYHLGVGGLAVLYLKYANWKSKVIPS